MRRFSQKSAAGFSLIELMVVISIISALTSMSIPGMRKFKYAALKAEAHKGLNATYASAISYFSSREGTGNFNTDCPSTTDFADHRYCNLVWGSRATATSCNLPNPFGFSVTDCKKNNYEIYILQLISNMTAWRVIYHMKADSIGGNARGADSWETNRCQQICQSIAITDVMSMTSTYILDSCPAANGASNNYFNGTNCRGY